MQLVGATSFVPTLWAPAAETRTPTGAVLHAPVFDPALRFGLTGTLLAPLPARSTLAASWGLLRDQRLCDVCAGGAPPGWLGSELLGSTDLSLSLLRVEPLDGSEGDEREDSTEQAGARRFERATRPVLVLRADLVLPASRDALVCNVMYAAPGAGATFRLPAGGSTVTVGVSARRPVYRYDAAPVGRCAPPLHGLTTVRTLTGEVEPTPWSAWFGSSNPTLQGSGTLGWTQVHAVVPHAPERLRSQLSVGLAFERAAPDPPLLVETLTGTVEVAPSTRPVRTAVPWSIEAGYGVTDRLDLSLSLSETVPTLIADPAGAARALPAATSATLAATARL